MRSSPMIVAAVVAPHPFQLRIGAETTRAPEVTHSSAATRLRHIMTKVSTVGVVCLRLDHRVHPASLWFVDIDSGLTRISQRQSSRASHGRRDPGIGTEFGIDLDRLHGKSGVIGPSQVRHVVGDAFSRGLSISLLKQTGAAAIVRSTYTPRWSEIPQNTPNHGRS